MPDKLPDSLDNCADAFFALRDHRIVTLEGRDAAAFAQAQFINDVSGLQPSQWQWSGWLTPKGRVLALFALLKRSEESVWLLLPDADAQALAASLSRFLFRSKAAIRASTELHVSAAFAAPARAHGNGSVELDDGAVELDLCGDGGARCLRIATSPAPTMDEEVARWRLFDLEHGWPRLDASQIEHWTPQQLSLERLRGFSVKKGCYPGQEIVARTHFLGKAKRGLALLEADDALVAGAEVRSADKTLGSAVSAADADGRHLALAVLPLEREAEALDVGGASASEIPFKSGLAR